MYINDLGAFVREFFIANLEWLGVLTGFVCVWLNVRQHIAGWFFAIVSAGIYIKVFYDIRLLGEMYLQVFFIFSSLYGWWQWRFGKKGSSVLHISYLPERYWYALLACAVLGTGLLGRWLLGQGGDLAYIDAALVSTSLVATWMLARKYLENWLLWIAADLAYIFMYLYKGAYPTALLYTLYLGLAYKGYRHWQKQLQNSKAIHNPH